MMTNHASDGTTRSASRTLANDTNEQLRATEELLAALDELGYGRTACFAVRLAVEEALVNAFRHGCGNRSDASVHMEWHASASAVTITIEDEGTGFNPEDVPDPTAPDRLEIPAGRGLMLIRAYMTDVQYNERGNRITMRYENPAPPA